MLNLEGVVDLLEARYNMEEIESMRGVQLEVDDMPHVEMILITLSFSYI